VKLVHLVGFITKKFVTIHSHMNAKKKKKIVSTHSSHICFGVLCQTSQNGKGAFATEDFAH